MKTMSTRKKFWAFRRSATRVYLTFRSSMTGGDEIEPDAAVDVSVELSGAPGNPDDYHVVHFADEPDDMLPTGTYQLRETAALPGYHALYDHLTFNVSAVGAVTVEGDLPDEADFDLINDPSEENLIYQFTLTNTKEYKVSVWKTDENDQTLTTGAEFALYRAEDYYDTTPEGPKEGAEPLMTGVTGENGVLFLGTLLVGEYRLVETKAPTGYNRLQNAVKIAAAYRRHRHMELPYPRTASDHSRGRVAPLKQAQECLKQSSGIESK